MIPSIVLDMGVPGVLPEVETFFSKPTRAGEKAVMYGCRVFATVRATAFGSVGYNFWALAVTASVRAVQPTSRVKSSGDLCRVPGMGFTSPDVWGHCACGVDTGVANVT